jgi:hypothetical protein
MVKNKKAIFLNPIFGGTHEFIYQQNKYLHCRNYRDGTDFRVLANWSSQGTG